MLKEEVTVLDALIAAVKMYPKMGIIKQGNRFTAAATLNVATTFLSKNIHIMHIIPKYV